MQIEFDQPDIELLRRVLDHYLGNLRMEIGRTDDYEFRQSLHAEEDRLKGIIARIAA